MFQLQNLIVISRYYNVRLKSLNYIGYLFVLSAEVQPDVQGQEVPTVSEFVQLFEETHVAPAVRAKQSVAICEIHGL